jgi:predicted DNA-binding transcriptional regulator AlpA
MANIHSFADPLRSREETARILNMSTRTLIRLEKEGRAPQLTRLSERCMGYRDSAIKSFLDSLTKQTA